MVSHSVKWPLCTVDVCIVNRAFLNIVECFFVFADTEEGERGTNKQNREAQTNMFALLIDFKAYFTPSLSQHK